MPDAPAGWYPDAVNNVQRYWDGTGWTDQTQPLSAAAPELADTGPLPHVKQSDELPLWKKKRFFIPGGVLTAFILLIALVGIFASPAPTSKNAASSDSLLPTPPYSSIASTPATSAAATTASSAPTTKRITPTPVPTTKHKSTPKPATRSPAPDDGSFKMPNEVGKVLQDAQDDIQRVSGDPVFFSHSHDLLGSRYQILDSDWKVCTQNLPPGTKVSAIGHIDFGAVKLDETCP